MAVLLVGLTGTTTAQVIVDYFDYANQTALWNVWGDYWTNGSDAQIFLEMDPSATRNGYSVEFLYHNFSLEVGKYIGSWMDAQDMTELEVGSDWTIGGVNTLSVHFRGDPCSQAFVSDINAARMWVELEDTSSNTGTVYYDDVNDMFEAIWHKWDIDLDIYDSCGVTLSAIDSVSIGVGGTKAGQQSEMTGGAKVWFDDIWLTPATAYIDIVVDNFDLYVDDLELRSLWDDYWVHGGDSEIFLEKDLNCTLDGNSMRYEYTNTTKDGGNYIGAQVDANLADLRSGPDWTIAGVKALVLYFLGDPCTVTADMEAVWPWVELEDTNGNTGWVKYPDPNHVTEQTWHEWNIDLSIFDACGVMLSSVDRFTIGIGGVRVGQKSKATTTNRLWIDGIRLHPPRCVVEIAHPLADLTEDCIVDFSDLKVVTQEWLTTGVKADLVDDDIVNFEDFDVLADNWLAEQLWP